MEIVKQNETFNISETQENGWQMNGSASKDVQGAIGINFNVQKHGELVEIIGECNYYKPSYEGQVSLNYNVPESHREELTVYSDKVIDTVLQFLETSE